MDIVGGGVIEELVKYEQIDHRYKEKSLLVKKPMTLFITQRLPLDVLQRHQQLLQGNVQLTYNGFSAISRSFPNTPLGVLQRQK